ncbi:MAG: succinate dehydrogenase [Chlamydiae bacterium]|nr:succinate dehydrogenase [Chlamydiota bacterium]
MTSIEATDRLPRAFVWRRLHSLTGFLLVIFLIEHLLVNSQAALLLGESGRGFVEMVNAIHNLPYLQVIELTLIGIPILIHTIWGIKYLFTAKYNSFPTDGTKPYLKYERNHAYTFQRITSWILLVLLTFHIVKFRFLHYPDSINVGAHPIYYVTVSTDSGLYTVADRIGVKLYNFAAIQKMGEELKEEKKFTDPVSAQRFEDRVKIWDQFSKIKLKKNQIIAAANNFGSASLLVVRDTFKNPFYIGLYTIFVLSACYHAFNGFWTFLITWGWILKMSSQKRMVKVAFSLMLIIAFLGLVAVWGTYWLNLKN